MLIASNSKKIALDIVYFMAQLDAHQTDVTLLVRDKFCLTSIVHPLFVLFRLLFMFLCLVFSPQKLR